MYILLATVTEIFYYFTSISSRLHWAIRLGLGMVSTLEPQWLGLGLGMVSTLATLAIRLGLGLGTVSPLELCITTEK